MRISLGRFEIIIFLLLNAISLELKGNSLCSPFILNSDCTLTIRSQTINIESDFQKTIGALNMKWTIISADRGKGDGSVRLQVDGGVPPFTWKVSDGSLDTKDSVATVTNVACGYMRVVVTDGNGAQAIIEVPMYMLVKAVKKVCASSRVEFSIDNSCHFLALDSVVWMPESLFSSSPASYTQEVNIDADIKTVGATMLDIKGNVLKKYEWLIREGSDQDGDGICDFEDNCVSQPNVNQNDTDNDGIGDVCDDPSDDVDRDGYVDWFDTCPLSPNNRDADGDGICDYVDNCPWTTNPHQYDGDGDGVGDACDRGADTDGDGVNDEEDIYPFSYTNNDIDGDRVSDRRDNCPNTFNPKQADKFGGGVGDDCNKRRDTDGDQVLNEEDPCPLSKNNRDVDGDGICDYADNCRLIYNPYQEDSDKDGIGDACDLGIDTDGDGVKDSIDPCPRTVNNVDTDGDGVCDDFDNCIETPNKHQAIGYYSNVGLACADGSGDVDEDGIPDYDDNCVYVYNRGQEDQDEDGIGDVCDLASNDFDKDGISDHEDNCPILYNPDQVDSDRDGIGDACEETLVEVCGDGIDNDGDELSDCEDPDCIDYVSSIVVKNTCPGECAQLFADKSCGNAFGLTYRWLIDSVANPNYDDRESICLDVIADQKTIVQYVINNERGIRVGHGAYQVNAINQEARVEAAPSNTLQVGGTVELSVWPAQDVVWRLGEDTVATSPSVHVDKAGTYTVVAFDYGGCEFQAQIEVLPKRQ